VLISKALKIISSFVLIASVASSLAAEVQSQNPEQAYVIKDYGVHGHLFDIQEESLLKEIMEKLEVAEKNGTLDQLQEKFTEKVKAKVLRPTPVPNLKKANVNRSWNYNPSFTQETDIVDDKGNVIVTAGTTVNALVNLSWGEPLILIDGEDKEQVQWANKIQGKIVLTNGTPLDLGQELKRQVYFDQGGIFCNRFGIKAVPALVTQDGLFLKISEVKL
jgi:conjugal transfer pilus assembly protein TraW